MTVDELARDDAGRAAIDGDLGATLFVEAGAGSGKTTHLVRRVVALVAESGIPLTSIAAITFTEAAAAELRLRIREALEEAAGEQTRADDERERCRLAAADVDLAAICTLHAFAQRILAEFPLEVGLPPVIEVLDEIRSALAFDQRFAAFLDGLYGPEGPEELVLAGLAVGIKDRHLRQVTQVFDDNHDRLHHVTWPPPVMPRVDLDGILDPLHAALDHRAGCRDPDDKLCVHLEGTVAGAVAALESAGDLLERLDVLVELPKLTAGRLGQKGNWPDGADEVRGLLTAAQTERERLRTSVVDQCLHALAERVGHFTVASAEARRAAGELEYHDLLVFARQLLREQPRVRRVLHERFRCLLLDEFQDTDPLQIELAVLIATDVEDLGALGPAAGWQALAVPPGRLFFVGDAKQSIYRFRRADIGLYLEARGTFAAGATTLARNFRSVPGVIDLVNGLFGDLFGEGADGQQPAYAPLVAVRGSTGPDPAVWVCGGPADASAPELREQEAAAVAGAVRQILDEGREVVVEGVARPARPDDIAILLPARTSLPQLEEALVEQRVPYRTETGSLVWAAREVRELFTVLQALDDPSDEVALVGALRSAAFGCADDELLEYRQAGGRWSYLATPPEGLDGDHPVVRGTRALRELHAEHSWVGVAGLVELVVRERRLLEVAVADRRPRDTWRRLRYVVDQARAFTESVGGSLRDFLDWADRQRSETTAAAAPVLPESDDRAVRILTIHGAKGLEFPIAVVSGLTTRPGTARHGVRVHFDDDGGPPDVALSRSVETADFDAVRTVEDQLDAHERLRLLYVALTRARDLLVVSGVHKPEAGAFGQLVWKWADAHRDAWVAGPDGLDPELPDDDLAPWEAAAAAVGVPLPDRAAWLDQRARQLAGSRPAALAATSIAETAVGPWMPAVEAERDEGSDPTRPPWARGRGATALGRAVHAVLQVVDVPDGAELGPLARAHAAAEGVPEGAAEVERRVRAALAAPLVSSIGSRRSWREVYVSAPVGDIVVEGFVDLLIESDDGLVVVDYKTDSVRGPDGVEEAYRRYRLQGAAYALALEEHLGRPVAGVTFLFLTERGAIERPVDDLRAAIDEARTVAGGIPPGQGPAG